jgi:membrane associated rhomboid family serine protease
MGIYDRDYYRNPPPRSNFGGNVNPWSVNTWLIVINVAVFVLNSPIVQTVFDGDGEPLGRVQPIYHLGYFSVVTAVLHAQVWRFVTFQFLHANVNHILFNMIALFFFGPMIESYLGSRKYLAFYLLCGVAGPVAYMVLWALQLLHDGPATPLVGASAGIFGVLIAAATVAPDSIVLIWGILPLRLRTFAWILMAIAVYTVFTSGNNAGGQAAHLGGAAAGYALIRNPRLLAPIDRLGRRVTRMRYRP